MPKDAAYYAAEEKIQAALRSGGTEQPLPTSPKGEESKVIQKMINPNHYDYSNSPSPLGGKLEGGF